MKKLVATTLILLLLIVLAACQTTPTPPPPSPTPTITRTPIPPTPTLIPTLTPIPPLNSPNGPPLRSIRMFTIRDGWGLINDALLVTHDGGITWASVPLPEGVVDQSSQALFLSEKTAYLLVRAPDGQTGLFHYTDNGGATWQVTPVPFLRGQLTSTEGWNYFMEEVNVGADSMEIAVYVMNEGLNWIKVFPDGSGAPGTTLPEEGIKTGISFMNWDNGWLGLKSQTNKIGLYQTSTTGRNWFPQDVPLPQNISGLKTSAQPPFFVKENGVLPVDFATLDNGDANRVFYSTHDGGATWTPGGSIPEGGVYTFFDANTGWAWGKRGLYFTSDGAQTWLLLPVAFNRSEHATCINFIDPKNGWLVTVGQNSRVRLYRTTDGGYTWTITIP